MTALGAALPFLALAVQAWLGLPFDLRRADTRDLVVLAGIYWGALPLASALGLRAVRGSTSLLATLANVALILPLFVAGALDGIRMGESLGPSPIPARDEWLPGYFDRWGGYLLHALIFLAGPSAGMRLLGRAVLERVVDGAPRPDE